MFIDPKHQAGPPQTEIYTVLSDRPNHGTAEAGFTCKLHGEAPHNKTLHETLASKITDTASDDVRTIRLALAVTGKYMQLYGGTKAYALAGASHHG